MKLTNCSQNIMTIDKSLKIKAGSVKSRNVLTRPERIEKLKSELRFKDGDPAYGIAKVRVVKISMKKKKVKSCCAGPSSRG